MSRLIAAIVASVGTLVSVGLQAQQTALPVAGKWEVTVDRQPTRTLELTVDGTTVNGTLTKPGSSDTVAVTGEVKKVELIFWTPEKEEFIGVIIREGSPVQGTYVYCPPGRSQANCAKSAVTMKRPTKTN